MRKALFLGINQYDNIGGLNGCANDAQQMSAVLSRHADGRPNFSSQVFVSPETNLSKSFIEGKIKRVISWGLRGCIILFLQGMVFLMMTLIQVLLFHKIFLRRIIMG